MTEPQPTDAAQPQQAANPEQPRHGDKEQQADLVDVYDDDQLAVPDTIFHG